MYHHLQHVPPFTASYQNYKSPHTLIQFKLWPFFNVLVLFLCWFVCLFVCLLVCWFVCILRVNCLFPDQKRGCFSVPFTNEFLFPKRCTQTFPHKFSTCQFLLCFLIPLCISPTWNFPSRENTTHLIIHVSMSTCQKIGIFCTILLQQVCMNHHWGTVRFWFDSDTHILSVQCAPSCVPVMKNG